MFYKPLVLRDNFCFSIHILYEWKCFMIGADEPMWE